MVQEREGREGREGHFPLQNPVTVSFRYSRGEESGGNKENPTKITA
jgi:hypothetical protein